MRKTHFYALVMVTIIILVYQLHRSKFQITIYESLKRHVENFTVAATLGSLKHPSIKGSRSTIWPVKDGTLSCAKMEWRKKDEEVKGILTKLDQMVPNVTFTDIMNTTSAKNSKATLLNHKHYYCVGDPLMVQLDLYNHLGKRKEYGGDFLQARIYSSSLEAGASGRITDYRNGTYLVNFTLFWEGSVQTSFQLIHPSEGVSALWAARKKGYDKILFTGRFLNGTSNVFSDCGFNITAKELCEYLDKRDQEAFYCVKPNSVSCDALILLKTHNSNISYLTDLERSLLNRSNIGLVIPQTFKSIEVIKCLGWVAPATLNHKVESFTFGCMSSCSSELEDTSELGKKTPMAKRKCRIGMSSPFPSGFIWQNQWHPVLCSVPEFRIFKEINTCLKRKIIYLLGDSTLRQWIWYFREKIPAFQHFDIHGIGKHQNLLIVNIERNTQIHWKKHGHPLVTIIDYMTADHSYVAREIDNVAGDRDTVVVLGLGQHFRPFPIELFIRRMINIRGAIQRLLLRSPDTKVIIKTENTRETDVDQERFANFHGFTQYLVQKDIFRDLKVGFVDAWDMTIAYGMKILHPPDNVIKNQIAMFLTYIC